MFATGQTPGTTSLVLDAQGDKVAESRHFPYGGERWSSGTLPTDYRWTGQRQEQPLGLYHMGARFYDYALGRWISPDTLVPDPGNPQAFNRYSYVGGNPCRHVDPTGHCAGTPGEGKDDDCWHAYFRIIGILDGDFNFLSQWGLSNLSHLLDWLDRGVRLGSNSTWPGDVWTSSNVRDILTALDRVQTALGDATNAALGLVGGATLSFIKIAAGRGDPGAIGGSYSAGTNRIELFLLATAHERAVEVAIHEMGHAVDWHARPEGAASPWSRSLAKWSQATGWQYHHQYGYWRSTPQVWTQAPTEYARTSPGEDFAESLVWYVESLNPGSGGFSKAPGRGLSWGRVDALTTALGEFH